MKPTYFILIMCFLHFFSCQNIKENELSITTMNHTRPIEELKELVLHDGDTTAYDELAIAFMNEKVEAEYLIYSILMANKYNYPRAYYQVFYCLTTAIEDSSEILDDSTKALAINYLKKGAELKDPESVKYLGDLYLEGKYVPQDSVLGRKLEEEGKKLCGF